jgi:hypothetical protein
VTPTATVTPTNTPTLTPSPTGTPTQLQLADINGDGVVNIQDYVIIGQYWLQSGPPGVIPADVNRDGVVNVNDYVVIGRYWLQMTGLPTVTPTPTH